MPVMQFVGYLGYVAVAILGGYLTIKDVIEVGDIQSFIQYVRNFTQPLQQIAQVANMLQSTAAASERVFEFLEGPEEDQTVENPVSVENLQGNVEFEHVRFGYNEDKIIINDFSADVKEGQKIAIVGPTGAGKTTMIKLLMRFYDVNGGSIKIDGHDVRDFNRSELREMFGMVLQDTWLFHGTISDNIRYGKLNATEEEVIQAAKAAHVHRFIQTLPGGYNMELNEEASNVAQGQKQLLTIARAILADPKILILDEATAALDVSVQKNIIELIVKLQREQGLTIGFICHDIALVQSVAHQVAVMYLGRVMEILPGENLRTQARHPYTRTLIDAVLDLDTDPRKPVAVIDSEPPSPLDIPAGCPFRDRCSQCFEKCAQEKPEMRWLSKEHGVACHLFPEER